MPRVSFTGQLKIRKMNIIYEDLIKVILKNVERMSLVLRSMPCLILAIKMSWKNKNLVFLVWLPRNYSSIFCFVLLEINRGVLKVYSKSVAWEHSKHMEAAILPAIPDSHPPD